jgi:hypothetical protein
MTFARWKTLLAVCLLGAAMIDFVGCGSATPPPTVGNTTQPSTGSGVTEGDPSGAGSPGGAPAGTVTDSTTPPSPYGKTLKVRQIDPIQGDVAGGTYVVVKGEGFLHQPRTLKIYFGSREGTIVRFQSDTAIIVQAPGGKPDEVVDVLLVFDPGGQLKLPKAFTFVQRADDPSVDALDNKR